MKPAVKTAIVVTCILLVTALFYPPWTDGYGRSLGFHFISGSTFANSYVLAKIDYARLVVIVLAICAISTAAYFIITSKVTPRIFLGLFVGLRYAFKPVAFFFSWMRKYWIWILIIGAALRLMASAL